MAGTMIEGDLAADLKASLRDSASSFSAAGDADFKRLLGVAALAFGLIRPRTMIGSCTVVADQGEYPLPADFHYFKSTLWGISPVSGVMPWDRGWPGRLPDFVAPVDVAGVPSLSLRPAPTAQQIAVLGSTYRYYYSAKHVIDSQNAANTTIREGDRGLLILRAQAEAMRELSFRNAAKPVQMIEGLSSQPRNGTAGGLYELLIDEFERACG